MKNKNNVIYNYNVILERDEKFGYFASVPNLPGCYTQGKTIEKTIENVKEAISLYLEVLRDQNKKVPLQSFVSLTNVSVII